MSDLILSADHNSKFIKFQEYRCALVSDKVYQGINLADLGLPLATSNQISKVFGDSQVLIDDFDGFRTQLYYDIYSDKFILGFGGTVPNNLSDWRTNFNQFFGKQAEEYIRGINLVNRIRTDYINRIIVTGHSLGGGIATVAAIARRLKCFVFNPPAIHPNTIQRFEPIDYSEFNDLITRYVVVGEALDLINKTISIKHKRIGITYNLYGSWQMPKLISLLLGRKLLIKFIPNPIFILASTIGIPLLEKSILLHGMNEVLHGLKKHLSKLKNTS